MPEQAPLGAEDLAAIRERCAGQKPYEGHEAAGTGLHNAYLRDAPRLLAEVERLQKTAVLLRWLHNHLWESEFNRKFMHGEQMDNIRKVLGL